MKLLSTMVIGKRFTVFSLSRLLTPVFLLLLFTSCAAPGGGLDFGLTNGDGAAAPAGGASGLTGTSDPTTDPVAPADPAAVPQASIPVPNVRTEYVIVYATDDSGVVPVKGFAGAADYDASYQMLVSSEDPATFVASRSTEYGRQTTSQPLHASRFTNYLLPKAHADDLDFGLCSESTATCCPIETDGSFECYLQTSASIGSAYLAIVDDEGFVEGYDTTTGATITAIAEVEDVNENALWLAQAPKSLAYAGESTTDTAGDMMNHFGALGSDMVVQVKETGGSFAVMGNYTESYHSADALNATQLGFDTFNNLTLLEEVNGIDLFTSYGSRTAGEYTFTDTGADTTVANTEAYTMLKLANNTLMFGRDRLDATREELNSIFNAIDGTETKFIDNDLLDSVTGDYVYSDNAISFDVDENGCALVVFSDNEGNLRMRASFVDAIGDEYHFGGESALSGTDTTGAAYTLAIEDLKTLLFIHLHILPAFWKAKRCCSTKHATLCGQ